MGRPKLGQAIRLVAVLAATGCNADPVNAPSDGSGGAGTAAASDAPATQGSGGATSTFSASATPTVTGSTTATTSAGASSGTGVTSVSTVTATSSGGASSGSVTSTTGQTSVNGVPIVIDNGWGTAEAVGIQGAFYTFSDNDDGGTFLINPSTYETAGAQICADGAAEQVLDMAYDIYWGGAIGFNLSQEPDGDTANPYDAATNGVTGFAFAVSELPIGGQLRFNAHVAGSTDSYCTTVTTTALTEYRWSDLLLNCWAPEAASPDPTQIEALHWQIVTNDSASYNFNFCITDLTALTD